jgi:hypothetical protein
MRWKQWAGLIKDAREWFPVQSIGCAPIVKAFHEGDAFAAEFPNAETVASGLEFRKPSVIF